MKTASRQNNSANASLDKDNLTDLKRLESSQTDDYSTNPPKKKKARCSKCKQSLGVIGFPCRCGGTFCSAHRYANEHSCSFDYKEHGAAEIRKNNPQVVGEKIQKI